MQFQVISGETMPAKAAGTTKYPFKSMKVGDCFDVPSDLCERVRSAAAWEGRRNGSAFSVRKHNDHFRCWRTA